MNVLCVLKGFMQWIMLLLCYRLIGEATMNIIRGNTKPVNIIKLQVCHTCTMYIIYVHVLECTQPLYYTWYKSINMYMCIRKCHKIMDPLELIFERKHVLLSIKLAHFSFVHNLKIKDWNQLHVLVPLCVCV